MANSTGGSYVPSLSYNRAGAIDVGGTYDSCAFTTKLKTGTAGAATVSVVEKGDGIFHQTVITLNNLAMSISDANVGGGSLIYTFPEGNIAVLGGTASAITPTTTSALASTLNASVTLSVGVGSVQTTTQGSGTLVTTQQDLINAFSATSSATINVAGTAGNGKLGGTTLTRYDGTATAQAVYLNCGVPTGTDIDGDATTTWTGVITLTWIYNGDY